jgi:uncharacterized protein (TIGR02099 family)
VTEGSARPRSARLWRFAAGALAGLLILAALVLGGLRLLVAELPANAARVQAWVEQQTHLRVQYRALDARLRWFGPEVVLKDVRILDSGSSQALFATREGSIGLDLWNFFRTGQLVAGRVRFSGSDITIVRLPDGRIRLLGQQERPADRPPFDLDRLPAGRVSIDDSTVTYRDLKTGRGPWTLTDVQLTLRRDRDFVAAEGSARLPASMGASVRYNGRLKGSLDHFEKLQGRVEVRASHLSLPGFAGLLPAAAARPTGGAGDVTAILTVEAGGLRQARLDLDLAGVALELPQRDVATVRTVEVSAPQPVEGAPGLQPPAVDKEFVDRAAAPLPREARYDVLAGDFRLRREGNAWLVRVTGLRTDSGGGLRFPEAHISGRWRGNPATTFEMSLNAGDVRIARVWPLVLAFAPPAFDRWSGLGPTGVIRGLRLEMNRTRAGAVPEFALSADVAALGVQPVAGWPGMSGITATLSGTSQRGRIGLRATNAALRWPRLFLAPITLQRAAADFDWRREGAGWVVGSKMVSLEHPHARARAAFEFRSGTRLVSPVLDLSAWVDGAEVAAVNEVLPVGNLSPRAISWLQRAFVRGQVANGRLHYLGPVRQFPFRNGEGEFTASADVSGATVDYYAGFAPLTGAAGTAVFHNAGMQAEVREGDIGGLRIVHATYSVVDFRGAPMLVDATGTGDIGKALTYLQGSPLGPTLGTQLMTLSGRGPADYSVNLTLPTRDEDAPLSDHRVRVDLHAVTLALAALRAPARELKGTFELHNLEVRAPALRGTILGGPFELSIAPGALGGGVTAAVDFRGQGRASGAPLPSFIGLPAGIRMDGAADWNLAGRLERRQEGAPWSLHIDVSSLLAGLEIIAPKPFTKAAPDERATRVRIDIPGTGVTDFAIDSGSARARLRFAEAANGKTTLERGLARFDGQPVSLPSRSGLMVAGDWPNFDLAEWLALGSGAGDGPRLSEWLGPVDVHLDRALVAGFEFRDVTAHLGTAGNTWQVGVSGPMADGDVTIPDDLSGNRPIELQMRHLHLQAPAAQAGKSEAQTDPRSVPALSISAGDFSWQSRRFGQVQATISRDPLGLRFDSLASSSPEFTVKGRGSWLAEGQGSRTRLEFEFSSTDLAAATRALGYNDAVEAKHARLSGNLAWAGGPGADALAGMDGTLRLELGDGQLRNVKPGAGRMLGLMSVVELPRRLTLDFRDVTDKGLAFDKVHGDFTVRNGNAFTQNLLLKGAAVDIGVVGRTGLATEDYDQTIVVSGNPGGPLTVAGAFAAGPVVGAGVLVLSQLFKGQLQGLTRAYYHVTGPWANPVVERISAPAGENAEAEGAKPAGGSP